LFLSCSDLCLLQFQASFDLCLLQTVWRFPFVLVVDIFLVLVLQQSIIERETPTYAVCNMGVWAGWSRILWCIYCVY
jgi:hypothetical protein